LSSDFFDLLSDFSLTRAEEDSLIGFGIGEGALACLGLSSLSLSSSEKMEEERRKLRPLGSKMLTIAWSSFCPLPLLPGGEGANFEEEEALLCRFNGERWKGLKGDTREGVGGGSANNEKAGERGREGEWWPDSWETSGGNGGISVWYLLFAKPLLAESSLLTSGLTSSAGLREGGGLIKEGEVMRLFVVALDSMTRGGERAWAAQGAAWGGRWRWEEFDGFWKRHATESWELMSSIFLLSSPLSSISKLKRGKDRTSSRVRYKDFDDDPKGGVTSWSCLLSLKLLAGEPWKVTAVGETSTTRVEGLEVMTLLSLGERGGKGGEGRGREWGERTGSSWLIGMDIISTQTGQRDDDVAVSLDPLESLNFSPQMEQSFTTLSFDEDLLLTGLSDRSIAVAFVGISFSWERRGFVFVKRLEIFGWWWLLVTVVVVTAEATGKEFQENKSISWGINCCFSSKSTTSMAGIVEEEDREVTPRDRFFVGACCVCDGTVRS
jgi:hypothetical protein